MLFYLYCILDIVYSKYCLQQHIFSVCIIYTNTEKPKHISSGHSCLHVTRTFCFTC